MDGATEYQETTGNGILCCHAQLNAFAQEQKWGSIPTIRSRPGVR